jgi:hypothetical protein
MSLRATLRIVTGRASGVEQDQFVGANRKASRLLEEYGQG